MSRLYDTIEPSVIDEQMLKKCVEEQGPKGEAGRIAKQEGLDFIDVLALRLDFKSKIQHLFSRFVLYFLWMIIEVLWPWEAHDFDVFLIDILKIDNLWSFVSLTKLQLDNNIIERIEGLEMLVNLEWLGEWNVINNDFLT